ncbi:bifunctional transcriptional activator/DNA repair enzyme AdaA [Paenisporosarcina sp. TG-14]|uniref:bifunctional transcriptional activator/DNA repair enzyme AdaA n=1 Tax=Paenisporosarcina sp. TG-14 TaxID=1231057 RepID=UPI0002DA1A6D|nr:Ada metal-binding domain-containing protein [Paenisporosarcina sp. TG-14]
MKEIEWIAVSNNDDAFDGQFYYGVSTTLIFCRPSCHSKMPLRKHVSIFYTLRSAKDASYRPCKRCRPEDLIYTHPSTKLVNQTLSIIESQLTSPLTLKDMAEQLFVSSTYLQKVFMKETKVSPSRYLTNVRMSKAKHLLQHTDLLVINIAQSVGYQNAAHFSTAFQRYTGNSPTQYRTKVQ